VRARQFTTVERLASHLAAMLFECFPTVGALEITVAKLSPPMDAIAEAAGVTLKQTR